MKKYNLGLICGRFGPIHKGHQSIINTSIERCDKTLIFVGSAQESGTLRNPFSADFRKYFADIFYREGGFRLCMRL